MSAQSCSENQPPDVVVHRSAAADRGERRPLGNLDAPPLVVGEVEVQPVQLVAGDELDEADDVVDADEVARHVEHRPSPLEPRDVDDVHRWQGGPGAGREQLHERATAVPQAVRRRGDDGSAVGRHQQLVPFGAEVGPVRVE